MYNGEVNVTHAELNSFLDVAEKLKVRGLTTAGEKEKKIQGPSRRKQSNNASEDAGAMSSPNKKPKISHVQGGGERRRCKAASYCFSTIFKLLFS